MNIEEIREYCLLKEGVTEEFPFDTDTLVFKVRGKAFLFTSLTFRPFRVNLKMNVELVAEYRDRYADIQAGYHMNKKHWNSVYYANGTIPKKELCWLIDHSYQQVVKGLPKKTRDELEKIK